VIFAIAWSYSREVGQLGKNYERKESNQIVKSFGTGFFLIISLMLNTVAVTRIF